MDGLRTRAARLEDIEFLADLFSSAMRESITAARGYWDPLKERDQFREQLEIDQARVLQVAGNDIGFVTTRRVDGALLIGTLCVAEAHQGAGIGSRIVREVMSEAERAGLNVELFVLKANTRARALYLRLGFVETEQLPHHVRMRWSGAS